MGIERRDFLVGAATAATLTGLGAFPRSARAAGDTAGIRVAVIGLRGRGKSHIQNLAGNIVALCDVDKQILAERAQQFTEKNNRPVETFSDYRRLLERDDIDAVSIATPNHNHSLIAIAAIQAGKDVYTEKPVSHNVWEGRQLVAAARKHDRIVQCGTQSRSSSSLQQAAEWVQGGGLGKIEYALGTCYKPRKPIGQLDKPLAIADGIDYDLWCGPAEKNDLYRPSLHYDWHWDWNTGNGDMGNQGIHQMDIARWFLGEDRLAPRTISIGSRLGYQDAADTPNTQVVYHDYKAAPLIFETRGLPRSKAAQGNWESSMDRYRGAGISVLIQCEGGHVFVPNTYNLVTAHDRSGAEIKRWEGSGNHYANWLGAVAARDRSLLNADILEGHLSSSLCHTGGVSHRIGTPTVAGEISEQLAGNDLLSSSFDRMASHLRANAVDIDSLDQSLTLGPWLELDTETEQFVGNDAASELRTRKYREPFRVPDMGA